MPFATGKRRTRIMFANIAILLIFGWIDYVTGYEFGFFIFYFLPVTIAAWYGRFPGDRHGLRLGRLLVPCGSDDPPPLSPALPCLLGDVRALYFLPDDGADVQQDP